MNFMAAPTHTLIIGGILVFAVLLFVALFLVRIPAMPVHHSGASQSSVPVHAGLMCGGVGRVFENLVVVNDLCG